MNKGFEFQAREGEPLTLHEAVFQAVGAASMAWTETPTGIFDEVWARVVGDRLVEAIRSGEVVDLQ